MGFHWWARLWNSPVMFGALRQADGLADYVALGGPEEEHIECYPDWYEDPQSCRGRYRACQRQRADGHERGGQKCRTQGRNSVPQACCEATYRRAIRSAGESRSWRTVAWSVAVVGATTVRPAW